MEYRPDLVESYRLTIEHVVLMTWIFSGTEANAVRSSQIPDFGSLENFRIEDATNLTRNPLFNQIKSNRQALADAQFGALSKTLASADSNHSAAVVGSQPLLLQMDIPPNLAHISVGRENWGDSNMADGSPRTDTSTDDTEEKNQRFGRGLTKATVARILVTGQKIKRIRRRCVGLLKIAYVQQLESSRLKLTQLEQELQRARQQGIFISSSGDQSRSMSGNGALAFDAEYARWLEEHNRHISELRAAVNSHAGDTELRTIVDSVIAN
ncbi:Transcription factor HBP-1b(c38) [Hibiscus syriacus]|uniref:Transcription factor HBP-1b(C38) n=1 Tax=Hibiscus syriacus TaxID=106335 RepID=A0A6A2YAF1_HIBSY|nr:Transcription factor HBP-1b(c38) [Hibiscus syriacus]